MATGRPGANLNSSGLADLKARIIFLLVAIFVFRVGSYIPVPGLNPQRLQELLGMNAVALDIQALL